jgi:general secretion pathway protein N
MISRIACRSLAAIVALATAATLAATARAQAPEEVGASVRADLAPIPAPATAPAREAPPAAGHNISGNPLWGIPLKQLSVTRDRPIFSPSRRPPPPAVVNRPFVPPPVTRPPPPKPPEHPNLALLGTIAGENEGIALFMETTTQVVVRLRTGEAHEGWVLRSVHRREAQLEKDSRTETMTLPNPGGGSGGEAGSPDEQPQAMPPPPRDIRNRPSRR